MQIAEAAIPLYGIPYRKRRVRRTTPHTRLAELRRDRPAIRSMYTLLPETDYDGRPTHNSPMGNLYYERADYSVVVKNRAPPPKAWRWEIYRAGNVNPIKQSSVYFDTTAAARRAGKEALNELLNKLFA